MTSPRNGPPDVLFVNGASSAGKTSLIRAVQDLVSVPYLHVGLDHCFASVPEPWDVLFILRSFQGAVQLGL